MIVQGIIYHCDYTGQNYKGGTTGLWVIARGATGRWCCVLWLGPGVDDFDKLSKQAVSLETATKHIEGKLGEWLDL